MILLNKEVITQQLDDKTLGLTIYSSIDSTNNAFNEHLPTEEFSVCLAETQTQGRGQFQRNWYSPFGENIYLSLCYYSSNNLSSLSGLSLVAGVVLCKLINTSFALKKPTLIKWPNDILYKNSKLAGILVETKKMPNNTHRVIIGIGLNVNMQHDTSQSIEQNWTSLFQITRQPQDRNKLCALLINQLCAAILEFERNGFQPFLSYWNQYNAFKNKQIQLTHNKTIFIGKCIGVSPKAELMISIKNGEEKYFSNGEVSLHESSWKNTSHLFAKYFIVALASYGVDIGLFSLLFWSNISLLYSLFFSRTLSSVFNFLSNKWFVYQSKNIRHTWKESIGYIALVGVNLLLSYGIIRLEIDFLKIPTIPSKILADAFLLLFSFYIQKKIIFKHKKKL